METNAVLFPLQRLWQSILRQAAQPPLADPGHVDAIVRLLRKEQVVRTIDRPRSWAGQEGEARE